MTTTAEVPAEGTAIAAAILAARLIIHAADGGHDHLMMVAAGIIVAECLSRELDYDSLMDALDHACRAMHESMMRLPPDTRARVVASLVSVKP